MTHDALTDGPPKCVNCNATIGLPLNTTAAVERDSPCSGIHGRVTEHWVGQPPMTNREEHPRDASARTAACSSARSGTAGHDKHGHACAIMELKYCGSRSGACACSNATGYMASLGFAFPARPTGQPAPCARPDRDDTSRCSSDDVLYRSSSASSPTIPHATPFQLRNCYIVLYSLATNHLPLTLTTAHHGIPHTTE
jgi:hypothetical protein